MSFKLLSRNRKRGSIVIIPDDYCWPKLTLSNTSHNTYHPKINPELCSVHRWHTDNIFSSSEDEVYAVHTSEADRAISSHGSLVNKKDTYVDCF